MNTPQSKYLSKILLALTALVLVLGPGCENERPGVFQGYVEGEYVYIACPGGGRLTDLKVKRGQRVNPGDFLFALESEYEAAAVKEAEDRLVQAQNRLDDLKKGQRPTEIESIRARLKQTEASLDLAEKEYERRRALYLDGTISREELDRARTEYERSKRRVDEIGAELSTARLGARTDQVQAAEAEVRAARARLDQAEWSLEQKTRFAPEPGLVYDTFYSVGEWVPAGRPVAALLPPENVKARFFVPEELVGQVSPGQKVYITYDGGPGPISAKISYVSPQAEYTPPIIYSSDNRAKLVFMVEAVPAPEDAAGLNPGQPVDVSRTQ